MGAARFQPALDEGDRVRGAPEPLEHPVTGHRPLAPALRHDGHAHPRARVPSDRRVDDAFRTPGLPLRQRQVAAANRPPRELPGETVIGGLALGEHDEPRRALVETMHDAGTSRAPDRRHRRGVGERRGGEAPLRAARAGVGHHAGGLVDHQHVLVLVHDRERHRLRQEPLTRRGRDPGFHPLAPLEPVRRLHRMAVHADVTFRDQMLHAHARQLAEPLGQPPIEPRPRRVRLHDLGPVALAAHAAVRLSETRRAR